MDTVSRSTRSKRANLSAATYSQAETAALIGVSYTTINELVKAGTSPVTPLKVGRQYRFPKATVDRMLGLDGAGGDLSDQDPA